MSAREADLKLLFSSKKFEILQIRNKLENRYLKLNEIISKFNKENDLVFMICLVRKYNNFHGFYNIDGQTINLEKEELINAIFQNFEDKIYDLKNRKTNELEKSKLKKEWMQFCACFANDNYILNKDFEKINEFFFCQI